MYVAFIRHNSSRVEKDETISGGFLFPSLHVNLSLGGPVLLFLLRPCCRRVLIMYVLRTAKPVEEEQRLVSSLLSVSSAPSSFLLFRPWIQGVYKAYCNIMLDMLDGSLSMYSVVVAHSTSTKAHRIIRAIREILRRCSCGASGAVFLAAKA